MHESSPRIINAATATLLGYSLLTGSSAPHQRESIDCLKEPGGSVSIAVDSKEPSDNSSLTATGDESYSIQVAEWVYGDTGKRAPNNISISADSGPLGIGGSEKEIDAASGPDSVTFAREPKPSLKPPYYEITVVGDPDSSKITYTLTCDKDQKQP